MSIPISGLPAGGTVTGAELVPNTQSGVTVKLTTKQIIQAAAALAAGANLAAANTIPVVQGGVVVQISLAEYYANLAAVLAAVPVAQPTQYYPRTPSEVATSVTPVNYAYPLGNIIRYGGSTSATDNSTAFAQAALCSSVVYIPAGTWNFTTGVLVPGGCIVRGDGCLNPTNTGTGGLNGTILSFANGVVTCLEVNGNASNLSSALENFSVTRAGGTPPAGTVGILIFGGFNILWNNVWSDNHAIPVAYTASDTIGISSLIYGMFTSRATDVHLQMKTWPELKLLNCRFGTNGAFDYNCNGYIRVTGGSTVNASTGPNTLYVVNCQFNQGTNAASYWIRFENMTPGYISDTSDFRFSNCHIESISAGYVFSDSTFTDLLRFVVDTCEFNLNFPFLVLNAATHIDNMQLCNNFFAGGFNLAPTNQFNFVQVTNNFFAQNVAVVGVSASTWASTGNHYDGALSYSGSFGKLISVGDTLEGAFTFSATAPSSSNVKLDGSTFAGGSWTPALTSGGSASGFTYTTQFGNYTISGNRVHGEFNLQFTTSGLTAGLIQLTGLPLPVKTNTGSGGGVVVDATGFLSLGGSLTLFADNTLSSMHFTTGAATGTAFISNTNLGATVTMTGIIDYEWFPS